MNTKKLGQEPVYPFFEYNENGYGNTVVVKTSNGKLFFPFQAGMSKRFYADCAAMQGLLSSDRIMEGYNKGLTIIRAYELADELLKQEYE